MSLTTSTSKYQYLPNGATTVFPFPVYFLDNTHVVVTLTTAGADSIKTIVTDYTLTGVGLANGGNVTMLVAPAAGTTLTITRVVPITQLMSYVPNDAFPAQSHEQALDRLTMVCQQLAETVGRCIQFPSGEPIATSPLLPAIAGRSSKVVAFNNVGNLIVQ